MSFVLVIAGNPAELPFAPSLLEPENGSYEDLAGSPTFMWQYNPGNPADISVFQTGYSFAVIANGGATQYWNGLSFQSTPIWVASTAEEITFPPASFSDGIPYQWAVATEDQNGQGPFSTFFVVNAQGIPTVTVTAPTGTIVAADPIITWASSPGSGAAQVTYEVIIYNNSQYTAPGFEPGEGPSVFDTGVVGSATAQSLDLSMLPLYLENSTQYRVYVQISQTGGQLSNWSYSAFTTAWAAPMAPTITAVESTDPDTGYPVIELAVQGNDNLLSTDDADPTQGIGTWHAVTNCAVESTPLGLEILPFGAGTVEASTASNASGYPVLPNTEYTAVASFTATSGGESCTVGFAWYNSLGVFISTVNGTPITDTTTGPTQATCTATSPSQAAFALVLVTIA